MDSKASIGDAPLCFLVPVAVLIALHVAGAVFPGHWSWGFDFWSVLAPPFSFLIPACLGLLIIPAVYGPAYAALSFAARPFVGLSGKGVKSLWVGVLSVLLFALFYLWRSRAHVYGDGFLILADYKSGAPALGEYQDYLKGLALPLYHGVLLVLSRLTRLTPEQVFAATSCAGGVVGFWGILALSKLVTSDRPTRALVAFALVSSACVILFFGYIEYYTWAAALSLWSLYFTLKYVRTGQGLLSTILFSLLTVGFHILALPFLLVAALAVLYRRGEHRGLPFGLSFARIGLMAAVGSAVLAVLAQLLNLPQWLMLIWPIKGVPYWFFSVERIVDVLNLCLLVAPVGTILFVVWVFSSPKRAPADDPELSLLGVAALFTFLVAFWVEPKLGAARDWDFASFFGLPLTLWGAIWFVRRRSVGATRPALLVPMAVVVVLNLVPNLIEKNNLEAAAVHLDRTLWASSHHQVTYENARRAMVWGAMLYGDVKTPELARRNFERRLSADSTCFASWFNLGQIYFDQGSLDSSLNAFRQAVAYAPTNPVYLSRLAEVEAKLGLYRDAVQHVYLSEQIKPDDFNTQFVFGVVLTRIGKFEEAVTHFQRALRLEPDAPMPIMNIGLIYAHLEKFDSAYVYLEKSRSRNPGNPMIYEPLVKAAVSLGKSTEAQQLLDTYARIQPNAPNLRMYREMIRRGDPPK